jgi:hypothetical protein
MKLIFNTLLFYTGVCLITACGGNKSDGFDPKIDTDVVKHDAQNESADKPVITFEHTNYDFGTIKEGDKVSHSFKFTNNGKADLIIGDARGNCGCTVPKYPTQPIEPGESGVIDVVFNSVGKHGKQNKSVTLVTNCIPSTRVLTITGEVNPITQ